MDHEPACLSRRRLLGGTTAALLLAVPQLRAQPRPLVEVWKDAACGCCVLWIDHLKAHGLDVKATDVGSLSEARAAVGMPSRYRGCHVARVAGYAIEGHVPAEDMLRLLAERPDAIGLAVPGMPLGSPGMEVGTRRDAFDVLLIGRDGRSTRFNHYPARA